MILLIVKFFLQIGKLRIVPISDSYLIINSFQKLPNMSEEVVRTNYGSLSPYKDTDITFLLHQNDLLLWFSPAVAKVIRIPEAFLLYLALLSRDKSDRIAIFNTDPVTLIVIKDGTLAAQSVLALDSTQFIERLKKEHATLTVERYSTQEHQALLSSSYEQLSFRHWQ